MTPGALATLVRRDLQRTRGPLVTALVFFVGLGLGARRFLLGDVFPIDQVELEPQKTSAGLLSLLAGPHEPPGIEQPVVDRLRAVPGVVEVYPKLRFRFPSTARGGKELLGTEVGTHEMLGDGIDPALVVPDLQPGASFADPLESAGPNCSIDSGCPAPRYCEKPSGAPSGRCSDPVPAVVSRYLVELFDHGIAPAHGLPPVARTLVEHANGVTFEMTLGASLLGVARQGERRSVRVRVVGLSSRAIDLGVTLPVEVVRRWNREYSGESAATRYSSIVVRLRNAGDASRAIDAGTSEGLVPHDTRARDVSVLISGVLALLLLVAGVILLVAALNIAHTFRVLVLERQREIGLYRALGAAGSHVRAWMLSLALVVGGLAGAAGAVTARLCALIADWRAARDLPDFPFKPETFFAFPPWLWAVAVGFAATTALLGALGPAHRASKTDPARALSTPG